jgi:hypothetical protein
MRHEASAAFGYRQLAKIKRELPVAVSVPPIALSDPRFARLARRARAATARA